MTDFKPFHGWRYNHDRVTMEQVVAPPYDVISSGHQAKLYERSPYNCVRLILNRQESSDSEKDNRYTRARDLFDRWRNENILIREKAPCFYLYEQSFKDFESGKLKSRSALLGRLKLEPFEKGIVIAHEKTLSRPKEDRRKLLESTAANLSPVFGLYEDSEHDISSLYPAIRGSAPLFDIHDDENVRHVFWAAGGEPLAEKIHESLASKKIYIADGHHRYQTALDYAGDMRLKQGVASGQELPSDYVLMALVEFHDPGLVLLPTHRIVSGWPSFDRNKTVESLRGFFKVEPCSASNLQEALQDTSFPGVVLGLVFKDERFLLTLSDFNKVKQSMQTGKPDIWYHLDVNILSYFIFDRLWKFPESLWESGIQYTHSIEEALRMVNAHKAQAAFLLRPPKVEMLREMGKERELMPQKSTYFYPKLASGLVFYHHASEGLANG